MKIINKSTLNNNVGITTTSNNNMNYITGGYVSTSIKYNILGEEFETINLDKTLIVMISTLNVLGKQFYEELKKNNVSFPHDMDEFIQKRLKVLDRDSKIESIIDK